MPLLDHYTLVPEGEIGIWLISEELGELEGLFEMEGEELEKMERMTERRKKEWFSARWLIHLLSGRSERARCLKDEFGN